MKRKLTLVFFSFSFCCFGQTWQKLIENPFNQGGAYAYGMRMIDDTIYVSSAMYVTDTIGNTRAVISKHDITNGELLDFQQFKNDTLQNSLFNVLDAGYNQLYDSEDEVIHLSMDAWNDGLDSVNKPHYLQIDRALNVINTYPIHGFGSDFFSTFNGNRFADDGDLLFYGQRSKVGQFFDADSANTLLVKMTLEGEQLWSKRFDDSYTINSLSTLSDGDIVFNCKWVAPTFQNPTVLIKANSEGEEQWRIIYGGMYVSGLASVTEKSNGNIIVANSWNQYYVDEPGTDWWYKRWLQIQEIADSGDTYTTVQDAKYIATRNTLEVFGVEEMADSNFLVWGYEQPTTGYTYLPEIENWDSPVRRAFLMMLNENFDSLWHRTYYHPDDDWLQCYSEYRITDVAPLEGGGFITSGWGKIHDMDDLPQIWLMRLDEYGCLEPGCQNIDVTEIVLGFENSMSVFPNPVKDICTIEWTVDKVSTIEKNFSQSELIITDTQGRELQRLPVNNFGNHHQMQVDMSGYASGMYQLHWVSGSAWLDTVQIVKE